jgi:cell division protein FtsN
VFRHRQGVSMAKNADGQLELVLENRQLLVTFFVIVALCGVFFSLGYIVGRNTLNSVAKAPLTVSTGTETPSKPSPMPHAPEAARNTAAPAATEGSSDGQGSQSDLNFYQSVEQKAPDGKLVPPETAAAQGGTTGGTTGGAGAAARPLAEKSATQSLPATPPAAQAAPAAPPVAPPPPSPQPAASSASSAAGADAILIQVSALTRREDAMALVNILREKKLPVQVVPGTTDTLYHVVVGPFKYIKDAEQAKAALEKDGFRPIFKK